MKIIDTHAHLNQIENIEAALEEASKSGVEAIVAVGIDNASSRANLDLSKRIDNPKIHVAVGIHPEAVDSLTIGKEIDFVKKNIPDSIAVGEIGLDYWYKWVKKNPERKQQQRDVYSLQLRLAKEKKLPAIIHSRGAWNDCLKIAKEEEIKKAIFHWYSGPLDILDDILSCGYFVSATPSLAYSPQHQEAIKHAPIEQTLIETDSPVYFKDDQGGFKATPKDVFKTLKLYSQIKNIPEEQALNILNQNAKNFFGIKS